MKTNLYWIILCIVYGIALSTVSCSDDDENTPAITAPQDITYVDVTSSSFTATWTAISGANGYIVKIKDEWKELTDKFQSVSEPTATFTGLEPEKRYWIAVSATYANGTTASPFSKWEKVRMAEGDIAKEFASGAGIANLPFIIKTAGQLKLMAYLVNKSNDNTLQTEVGIEVDPSVDYSKAYYELANDIDMSEIDQWTPIGTGLGNEQIMMPEKNMFRGHLNGKGHTIKNFTIDYTGSESNAIYGLIGLTGAGCTISDLNIESDITLVHTGTIETSNYLFAGGFIGYNYRATVNNCTFKGSIHTSFATDIYGTAMVGGICGNMSGGVISNCMVEIATSDEFIVCANSPQVGGILGYGDMGTILYCQVIVDGSILSETKPINESTDEILVSASSFAGGICASSKGVVIGGCEVAINGTLHAKSKKSSDEASIATRASAGGIAGSFGADALSSCNILIAGSLKAEANNIANAGGAIGSQVRDGYGASGLHAIITGEIIANVENNKPIGSDASYAGGIYGTGSFQIGNVQDADAIIKGKIIATHPQIAMAGGIAGSIVGLVRCWTVIDKGGLVVAKGGVAGANCGGITGNLVSGGIYGSYSICKGVMSAESETATGRNSINIGGIAGAATGYTRAKKYLTGCYSLIEGTMTATGTTTFNGGIVGMSNAYTLMNSIYWWSATNDITGHSGVMGASDTFKMPDNSQSSLVTAAQQMNIPLSESRYGYYFYREKDKYLNITTELP